MSSDVIFSTIYQLNLFQITMFPAKLFYYQYLLSTMSHKRTLRFLSLYLFLNVFPHIPASELSKSCPIFPIKRPSHDAYSPINIITKDAIRANVSTPVHLRNGILGPLFIINTGEALEFYAIPGAYSTFRTIINGGVLCDQKYMFYKLRIWISQDPDGRSYNQIDGKGSPLTISLHYHNFKYKSFEEGLKHPDDGIVIVNYMITHGPIPNLLFILPDIAIRLFRFPGTSLTVPLAALLYAWFNIVFLINEYYAFYGSYLDLETGKEYPNVIQIQTAGIYPLLTKSQLTAFQSLLNSNGTALQTVAALHPQNHDVYLGYGFTETYALL